MYFTPHLVWNLIWLSSIPCCAISGLVKRQPLTSSGSTILSWPWENCQAWFSSLQKNFKGPHPLTGFFSIETPGNKTVNFSVAFHGLSCYWAPVGAFSPSPRLWLPPPSPFSTSSHTHWIRKVNLHTSVHISGMPQRSNSCWPLFQTHDPVCPKSSLGELQLIHTISTSYGECRARRAYSPSLICYKTTCFQVLDPVTADYNSNCS